MDQIQHFHQIQEHAQTTIKQHEPQKVCFFFRTWNEAIDHVRARPALTLVELRNRQSEKHNLQNNEKNLHRQTYKDACEVTNIIRFIVEIITGIFGDSTPFLCDVMRLSVVLDISGAMFLWICYGALIRCRRELRLFWLKQTSLLFLDGILKIWQWVISCVTVIMLTAEMSEAQRGITSRNKWISLRISQQH